MKLQTLQPGIKIRLDHETPAGRCIFEGTVIDSFTSRVDEKTFLTIQTGEVKNTLTIPVGTVIDLLDLTLDEAK